MIPEPEILQATLEDAAEILALQKLAYQSEAQIYNDWTLPPLLQTIEAIREEFNTHAFLKAVSNHVIIGSVRVRIMDNTCHIGRLIVHPEWRNRGIGTRLVAVAERMHSHVTRFQLFTGSQSLGNLHLYHKLGYRELRRELLSDKIELIFLEKIAHD